MKHCPLPRAALHKGSILSNATERDHLKRLRHETTLARFGELALRSDDLDEILAEACRLVGEALGTDLAKVMQLQADGETLLVRAGVGWKPGVVGEVTIQATDDTSEGVALTTGKPMISLTSRRRHVSTIRSS